MAKRGDIVVVDFPFTDVARSKARPALVVQNDRDNQKIRKTVVAMITGNLRRQGDPSHALIDPATPDGAHSGLSFPSLVSCNNLFTVEQTRILKTLGSLPAIVMQKVNDCLKAALELP